MNNRQPDNPANDQRKEIERALANTINTLSVENLRKIYIYARTLREIEERRPPLTVT